MPGDARFQGMMCYTGLAGLVLCSAQRASAQDQYLVKPSPQFQYSLSAEGFWLAGNTSQLIVGGRGNLTLHSKRPYRLVLRPSYFFGRVNGRVTDRETWIEGPGYLFPEGYRGSSWYGFILGISEHLAVRVALDYTHEAVVPEALKPNDLRLTFGFKLGQ